jgi:hypothetical protein
MIHQGAGQLLYCGCLKEVSREGTHAPSITPTLVAHRTHLSEQLSCHDGYHGLGRCDPAERVDEWEGPRLGRTVLYHDELLK